MLVPYQMLLLGVLAQVPAPMPPATSNGNSVHVSRDTHGVPHIFAPDEKRLFDAYGYTVAEDRLWQLELNRRAASGELAEILGSRYVAADRLVRTTGYTDAELEAQFKRLPEQQRMHLTAYVAGINRYIQEVASTRQDRLPYEFRRLGISPTPWRPNDCVAFATFMLRRFGEIGGREQANEALLATLLQRFGDDVGTDIFNDVLWQNDPGAPTTIPTTDKFIRPTKLDKPTIPPSQHPSTISPPAFPGTEQALQLWSEASVPSRLGSYAWAVAPRKSAEGFAMLYAGPQMGTSVPEVVHEVQLYTNDGLNVAGMAFAGVPYVLIGHNKHVAWASTTAVGDNVDMYRETLCKTDEGVWGTRYRDHCEPATARQEVIEVRGESPVALQIWRTVHGPAVMDFEGGTAMAQKRAHWQHEIDSLVGFWRFGRAQHLKAFELGVETIVTQHNFLYADVGGNIAYWQAGLVPVRPSGFDFRLPLPGDGSAEWPGDARPTPKIINPKQGYLANWNNKPSIEFDSSDSHYFGKQSRLTDLTDRLDGAKVSWQDMRDIPVDIGRLEMTGRQTRYLLAYLNHALQKHPPTDPAVQAAARALDAYDGTVFDNAITSTRTSLGYEIFSTWVDHMKSRMLGEVLQDHMYLARVDLLIRALDIAARGRSSLPMLHTYIDPHSVFEWVAQTFTEAVDDLREHRTADMRRWPKPRQKLTLRHPLLGPIETLWSSNRATFAQMVLLQPDSIRSESIFTLGQSGYIGEDKNGAPVFDAHFKDQTSKYRAFIYKPAEFLFAP